MISSTSAAGASPAKKGGNGNISSIFDVGLQDNVHHRFSELKKEIWNDSMKQSWVQVLAALKEKTKQVESLGSKVSNTIMNPLFALKLRYHTP
jgi:hypothetical protein